MARRAIHIARDLAKSSVERVWRSSVYKALLFGHDRMASVGSSRTRKSRHALILAPGGEGNIGDQAMFDAFLEQVPGPVTAVTFGAHALQVPPAARGRVELHPLPRIVRGMPVARWADVRRFSRLVGAAETFYMPGADTLDGGHVHASLARLSLARLARDAGASVVVQGFSWNTDVPSTITDAVRSLGNGCLVLPRDPASYRLLVEAQCRVTQGADIVFSASTTESPKAELAEFVSNDVKTAILNTSGLIHRRVDLRDAYAAASRTLHDRGYRVLFLPHVIRSWDDDLRLAEEVFASNSRPGDYLVRHLLSPAEVRHVAQSCTFTLTGRMHLAIMSLMSGTPAATISTVGKVDGLYEFFGLPELVIPLDPESCVRRLPQVVDVLDDDNERERVRARIRERLPRVRELALMNFPEADKHRA